MLGSYLFCHKASVWQSNLCCCYPRLTGFSASAAKRTSSRDQSAAFSLFMQELRGLHLNFPAYSAVSAEPDPKSTAVIGDRCLICNQSAPVPYLLLEISECILLLGDFSLPHLGCPPSPGTARQPMSRACKRHVLGLFPPAPLCARFYTCPTWVHTRVFQHKHCLLQLGSLHFKMCFQRKVLHGNGAVLGAPSFIFTKACHFA